MCSPPCRQCARSGPPPSVRPAAATPVCGRAGRGRQRSRGYALAVAGGAVLARPRLAVSFPGTPAAGRARPALGGSVCSARVRQRLRLRGVPVSFFGGFAAARARLRVTARAGLSSSRPLSRACAARLRVGGAGLGPPGRGRAWDRVSISALDRAQDTCHRRTAIGDARRRAPGAAGAADAGGSNPRRAPARIVLITWLTLGMSSPRRQLGGDENLTRAVAEPVRAGACGATARNPAVDRSAFRPMFLHCIGDDNPQFHPSRCKRR